MDGGVLGALTGRAGALGFLALSVALAIALVVTAMGAKRERDVLTGRIAYLIRENSRAQSIWKAQLSACQAAASPKRVMQTGGGPGDEATERLLAQGPEGIDVCARMESADRAVLSTLK